MSAPPPLVDASHLECGHDGVAVSESAGFDFCLVLALRIDEGIHAELEQIGRLR